MRCDPNYAMRFRTMLNYAIGFRTMLNCACDVCGSERCDACDFKLFLLPNIFYSCNKFNLKQYTS